MSGILIVKKKKQKNKKKLPVEINSETTAKNYMKQIPKNNGNAKQITKKQTNCNFFKAISTTKAIRNRKLLCLKPTMHCIITVFNVGQWSGAAIAWTRLRDHVHDWKSLLPIYNRYYWNPCIPFKINNYLAHWPKWKTQSCLVCSLQHTGTFHCLAKSHFWMSAYLQSFVRGNCRRIKKM